MKGFFQQVVDAPSANGFAQVPGGKGSHQKWRKGQATVLVPFNCYSRHTANAVLKAAGIAIKF